MAIATVVLTGTDSLLIQKSNNVYAVSVQATTGSIASVTGSSPFVATLNGVEQQIATDTIQLSGGEGFTVVAPNAINLIDNLTIAVVSGTVNVLIQT